MKTYIIVYSSDKKERALSEAIQSFAEPMKMHPETKLWNGIQNVWIIKSLMSAKEIRDVLLHDFFQENEHLLVLQVAGYAAWSTHDETDSQLLKDIL